MRHFMFVYVLVFSSQAMAADEPGTFGQPGVLLPSGNVSAIASRYSSAGTRGEGALLLSIRPSVSYFFAQDLAFVASVGAGVNKQGSRGANLSMEFGGGAAINIPIGIDLSFMPNASLMFGTGGNATSISLVAQAPLLLHRGNFFLGFGPLLSVDVINRAFGSSAGRNMVLGASTTIGGWLFTADDAGVLRDYANRDDDAAGAGALEGGQVDL